MSTFAAAPAGAVGDLGSPSNREERQRDVWNEASTVGMQLVLWLGMVAAAVMVWIGGAYSRALGVGGTEGVRVLRARTVVHLLLLAAFVVGVVRAVPAGRGDSSVGGTAGRG